MAQKEKAVQTIRTAIQSQSAKHQVAVLNPKPVPLPVNSSDPSTSGGNPSGAGKVDKK